NFNWNLSFSTGNKIDISNTAKFAVGMVLTGSGIQPGTVVSAIDPQKSITISKPAQARTNVSITGKVYGLTVVEYPHNTTTSNDVQAATNIATAFTYSYYSGKSDSNNFPNAYVLKDISSVKRSYTSETNSSDAVTSKVTHTYYPNGRGFQTI